MKNNNYVLMDAVANTGTKNSSKIDCIAQYALSVIATFTDNTAAGTLKIQGSNDQCPYSNLAADFTPANWVDIPSASVAVSSGATVTYQLNQICYRWVRVTFTSSGGAGTFTVYVNAQGM